MTHSIAEGPAEMPVAIPEGRNQQFRINGCGAFDVMMTTETSRPEHLKLMEVVVGHENMLAAFKRVRANNGAPGVDGMNVRDVWGHYVLNESQIKKALLDGEYQPHPVLGVEIPKPGGGKRQLGIPTALDRLIQQALHQVLSPIFDPTFSESSYGFRPGRSAHQAVLQARKHVASGRRWVVDMDLEKFFDRMNHDVLMARVARRVHDRRVLCLIRRYLRAGLMHGGVTTQRTQGSPQGGPLSPLLSNIMLDDLDKELERRGHAFCRYADDCNIYVRTKRSGERVMASITKFLECRLKLKVNTEKSAVDRPWNRKFLGYSMTWHKNPRLKVAPSVVKLLKQAIRAEFRKGRGRSLIKTIEALAPKLRGWANYYKLVEVKGVFEELDKWLRHKLRNIIWKQWKRVYTRVKRLMQRGLSEERAWKSAQNGRGPWWNSKASHMNQAFKNRYFEKLGLVSLLYLHRRFQSAM